MMDSSIWHDFNSFMAKVPSHSRMPIFECENVCDSLNIEFAHIDNDKFNRDDVDKIVLEYQRRNTLIDAQDILSWNGGSVPVFDLQHHDVHGSCNSFLWIKSFYGQAVSPGIFFHELGHIAELFVFTPVEVEEFTYKAINQFTPSSHTAVEHNIREAIAVGLSIVLARMSSCAGLSPVERTVGVLEQAASDAGSGGPYVEEAMRFICREMTSIVAGRPLQQDPIGFLKDYANRLVSHLTQPLNELKNGKWLKYQ